VGVNGSGDWNLTVLTDVSGVNNVTVFFDGNNYYNSFVYSTNFNVNKNITNSSINAGNVHLGKTVVISGQLDNYTCITSVNVTVDGHRYIVNVNSTGAWSFNYITTRVGSIKAIVSFNGNNNFTSFNNEAVFKVLDNKVSTVFSSVGGKMSTNGKMKLVATLKTSSGKRLSGKVVKFYYGKYYLGCAKTNSLGTATLYYKFKVTGKRTVKVVFGGDNSYYYSYRYSSVSVPKYPVVLINKASHKGSLLTVHSNVYNYGTHTVKFKLYFELPKNFYLSIARSYTGSVSYSKSKRLVCLSVVLKPGQHLKYVVLMKVKFRHHGTYAIKTVTNKKYITLITNNKLNALRI
jgi:hypothetical protein